MMATPPDSDSAAAVGVAPSQSNNLLQKIKAEREAKKKTMSEAAHVVDSDNAFANSLVEAAHTQEIEGDQAILSATDEGTRLMDKFRKSKGLRSDKGSAIDTYVADEPGRVIDVLAEVSKTKSEREDEEAERQLRLTSCLDWLEGLCSERDYAWKTWRTGAFAEGYQFKLFFISLVCANGVLIGIEADHGDDSLGWKVLEIVFLAAFSAELVIKIWCVSNPNPTSLQCR